jgi:histidinol-phosphate aminotransferase
VKMNDAKGIFNFLMEEGVIVRDRSKVTLCEGSLRLTVGSEDENKILIEKLEALL